MKNLLRPLQLAEAESEQKSLEAKLLRPEADKGAVNGQLRRLKHQTEKQAPVMPTGKIKDALIKETESLLAKISEGMPSQEEMRKNPPGAVDKHMNWEKRNKTNIIAWKNGMLRLNAGTDNVDIANLEKHRPTRSELNMNGAQITGTRVHLPPGEVALHNVMSAEDKAFQSDYTSKLIARAIRENDADMAKFLGINLDDFSDADPESIIK